MISEIYGKYAQSWFCKVDHINCIFFPHGFEDSFDARHIDDVIDKWGEKFSWELEAYYDSVANIKIYKKIPRRLICTRERQVVAGLRGDNI